MDKTVYWIWFQQCIRRGSNKIRAIRLIYNDIEKFYKAGEKEWRLCGCFTNREIENLKTTSLDSAEKIFYESKSKNYDVLDIDNPRYPKLLKFIPDPPSVIYVDGDIDIVDNTLCISVVGTRDATEYGIVNAAEISRDLAKSGVTVISGGAMGIDTAAHEGALKAGGKTIAVLGCGINYNYLMQNFGLRKRIAKNGALVSEFPPNYPPSPHTFPIRNRIISGLSLGTVVIEAGMRSGSLVTANHANNQNRDVFVLPVEESNKNSGGSLALIRDGAYIIRNADDVLKEYKNRLLTKNFHTENKNFVPLHLDSIFSNGRKSKENKSSSQREVWEKIAVKNKSHVVPDKKENIRNTKIDDVPDQYKPVFKCLMSGVTNTDEISQKLKIPGQDLSLILTEMEFMGLVKALSGGNFKII